MVLVCKKTMYTDPFGLFLKAAMEVAAYRS